VFESMKTVTAELNSKILDMAPGGCANIDKIPIMTTEEDIGQKALLDVSKDLDIKGMIV